MTNATPDSAPQTIYVQVTDERGARQTYPLTAAGLMIGEFSGSQIQLSGPGIARNHLWVRYVGGQATVRMLSDEHAVWLRDQVLVPGQNHVWPLQEPLTIGRYRLMLTPTAKPPAQPAPPPPSAVATSSASMPTLVQPISPALDASQPSSSSQLASDSVGIELAPNDLRLPITPGKPVNVPVILHNRRSAQEQVQVILSGLPTNNYSVDPSDIELAPNARRQVDVRISLPEAPEITPGERTITIIVKSLTVPDISSQRQVTWVVKRFLKKPNVQITPSRQLVSSLQTFMRRGSNQTLGANYNVQIENLSNEREFYSIRAESGDPSISCSLKETNKSLGPGEKAAVSLFVEPLAELESQRRLSSFKVLVRPDSQPSPEAQLGYLEHVTPAYALRRIAPILALVGMIALLLAGFFFLVRPLLSTAAGGGTPTPALSTTLPNSESAVALAPPPVDLGPLQLAAAQTTTALALQAQAAQGVDAGVHATQDAFATSAAGTGVAIATAFQATNVVIGTLQADATKGVGDAGATVLAINQQQTSTAQVAGAINQTGTALAQQLAPTETALADAQVAIAQTQTAQPNPTLTAAAAIQTQIAQTQTAIASITPVVLPPVSANAKKLLVGLQTLNIAAGDGFTMTVSVFDQSFRLLPVNDIPIQIKLDQDVNAGLGLNGITTVSTKDGVATFTKLFIGKAGTFTIQASSPVLPGVDSDKINSIVVVPSRVQNLKVTLLDKNPISGTLIPSSVFTLTKTFTVAVELFDRFGNLATNSNNSVSLAVVKNSDPNAEVSNITSFSNQISAINGVATFADFVPKIYEPNTQYRIKATYTNGTENIVKISDKFRIDKLLVALLLSKTSYPYKNSPYTNNDIKNDIVFNSFCNDGDASHSPALISSNPSSILNTNKYTVIIGFPDSNTKCQGMSTALIEITAVPITYDLERSNATVSATHFPVSLPADKPVDSDFIKTYELFSGGSYQSLGNNVIPSSPGTYRATATLNSSKSNYSAAPKTVCYIMSSTPLPSPDKTTIPCPVATP